MSTIVEPAKLDYQGVSIERPCAHCDTVSYHYDGKCDTGPCAVCGQPRRDRGYATHPLDADGGYQDTRREMHDWTPHSYEPAEFFQTFDAFDQMLYQVQRLGMPGSYTSDLFRDYQFIRAHPDTRFVWVVRPMGTHIIAQATDPNAAGYGIGVLNYLASSEPKAHVFWWNGWDLAGINWDTARVLLAVPRTDRPHVSNGGYGFKDWVEVD